MHRVVALCLDGLVAFDLTAPAQAFASAYRTLTTAEVGEGRMGEGGSALYEFSSCSVDGAEVRTTTGFAVRPQAGLSALETADTVVVPAYFDVFSPPPEVALDALRAASARGARVLSVCTGAFALAHAGLLDGRRATTHWAFAEELAKRFPAAEVDASVLYVDEGAVMTSAGLSAGIDLCLHAIRKDFGAAVGERVARHMVAAPGRRPGAVHRTARSARGRRDLAAGGDAALGGRAARPGSRRRRDGRSRRCQPAYLRPPFP